MKRPLTGLAVIYAIGIWIGSLTNWPPSLLLVLWTALFVAFLLLHRTRWSLPVLFLTIFTTGAYAYRHATAVSPPNNISKLVERRDQNLELRGVIVSDTGFREEAAGEEDADRLRFKLALQAIKTAEQWQPAMGTLLMFVSAAREPEPLRYGDLIECSAILRVPPPAHNPGTFDWGDWLARQNIQFTATIRRDDTCRVLAHDNGNRVAALSQQLRDRFERALRFGLETEPELAGVLAGMVIGERSEIPADTYADFQRTGVFHIFSVSGLNVTLVAVVVMAALRLWRVPRRWSGLASIPVLVLYVLATGGRPGAVRTLVMTCVLLVGWSLVRPVDFLNGLAAAALAILLWDPRQLFDGGFILSFGAVTSLVTLTPPLEKRLGGWLARDPFLPERLVPPWQRWLATPRRWVVRAVSGSVAAWIGLLPLMAVYFNLFSPISIVANVAVIPLLGAITALGMLAGALFGVWDWVTLTFNNANFFLLGTMIHIVKWLGRVPQGHWFVQAPPLWLVWVYYALGVLLLSQAISWRRRQLAAIIGAPAIIAAMFVQSWRQEAVELTVLDLNDGACVFLNVPGETHDVLIDGGSDWGARQVVMPFLRSKGVDRLGAAILTRGDKAHAAGLTVIAAEMPVAQAAHTGMRSRSKYYAAWLDKMRVRQIPVRTLLAGEELTLGNDVRVRALYPPAGPAAARSEDNALVLALEYGPTRVLLMSDAGETVEKLLTNSGSDLQAQIIVKGRHGKESSCTPEFLRAVRPEVAVLVVNTRPSDRYIEPGLPQRLSRRAIAVYRTDEAGAVTIRLTARGYTIHTHMRPD